MHDLTIQERYALAQAQIASTKLISKGKLIGNEMYTAYLLTDESREKLMEKFPPKYEKIIAHHITVKFGVPEGTELPPEADIKVIGYADSGDGIEALVVAIDGKTQRDNGQYFHITWSLNPDDYKPVDSNKLIGYNNYKLMLPTVIETVPAISK